MGQQQLLLIVLTVILVGIAIVVGITLFNDHAKQANEDAVIQECLDIIVSSQEWARKPPLLGGPTPQNSFTTLDFSKIGKPVVAGTLTWRNVNGDQYVISARNTTRFTLRGTGRYGSLVTYRRVYLEIIPMPTITR